MKQGSRLVFITGATRGLGRQIAEIFREKGDNLIFLSRSRDDLDRVSSEMEPRLLQHQSLYTYSCDIGDEGQLKTCLERILEEVGSPDIVINNAAIQGPIGPFNSNRIREWKKCMDVCLYAPVQICHTFLPSMITQSFGRIINISGGGAASPRPNFTGYATAKAGLVRFSECLAEEVSVRGITVNCVAPGAMNSALTQEILAAGKECSGMSEYDTALAISAHPHETRHMAADLVYALTTLPFAQVTGKLISAIWDPWDTFPQQLDHLKGTDMYTLRRIVPVAEPEGS